MQGPLHKMRFALPQGEKCTGGAFVAEGVNKYLHLEGVFATTRYLYAITVVIFRQF